MFSDFQDMVFLLLNWLDRSLGNGNALQQEVQLRAPDFKKRQIRECKLAIKISSYPSESQAAHSENQIRRKYLHNRVTYSHYIQFNILIIAKMITLFFASLSLLAFQGLARQVAAEPIEDPFFHPNPPGAKNGDDFYFEAVHKGVESNPLTSAAAMTLIIEAGGYANTLSMQLEL